MNQIEKISYLFEEIRKGRFELRDELFETIWMNSTRLVYLPDAAPLLVKINQWVDGHINEHPDFYELAQLSNGFIAFVGDHYDSAMTYYNKAIELFSARNDQDGVSATSLGIGYLHRSTGEIELALKHALPAMDQLGKSGKFMYLRIVGCYWIGGVYADTGHFEEALKLFELGLQLEKSVGKNSMAARITNGIAGVHMKQKNFSLALDYYQQSLDLSNETTEATSVARGLTDLGAYHEQMGNYQLAIQFNLNALNLRKETKSSNGLVTNLMNLGNIYYKQGKTEESIKSLQEALKLAETIRVKVKMYQVHQLLSDIYLGAGNVLESLAHYKAFHEIREDVHHEDIDRKVKNQVQLFKAEQTQKENEIIKAQKKEIEKKNIELQETIDELTLTRINRKAKIFTLGVAIILFIFAEQIIHLALYIFDSENYFLTLAIKIVIIFSLKPIDEAIEHYLLRRVIKKKTKVILM